MNAPLTDPHAAHLARLRVMCMALRDRLAATPAHLGLTAVNPGPGGGLELPPMLAVVTDRFGLTVFEAELLALALAVEIDPATAEAVRAVQPGRDPRPSFGLGFALLAAPHWSALSPERPLLRWQLLRAEPAALLVDAPLTLDPRLMLALIGAGSADPALARFGRQLDRAGQLTGAQREVAAAIAAQFNQGAAQLSGGTPKDREAIVRHAGGLGQRTVWRFGQDVPSDPDGRLRLARLIERESVLTGMVPLLDAVAAPQVVQLACILDAPFVLSVTEPSLALDQPLPVFDAPQMDFAARRVLWQAVAGALPGDDLDRLAHDFALDAQGIAGIGGLCTTLPEMRRQARSHCRTETGGLATRRIPRAGWADLALRPAQQAALVAIVDRVRQQPRVLHHWGYGRASGRGSGVTALFAGPSGTGKTLAAEVIATALDLDLLHVDLSCVVSKWLGETEKNLDRIFALAERGGAVLLFDEADALFGKRSEVKDSRDRYANLEVSFLLQRIEAFTGLALLTTNQQTALDEAFLRRINVVVHFPFPDADQRRDIWTRTQPARAPLQGYDPASLSQIAASGGEIRNMALGAAFAAAARGADGIDMADLQAAADVELAKLSRPRSAPRSTITGRGGKS